MKKRICVVLMVIMSASLFAQTSQNYKEMHDQLIRFYGYQRSGLKSGTSGNLNNQNIHQGDNYNGKQLDGGWNDAGDYIKFGMPLGFTVYCLHKSKKIILHGSTKIRQTLV
jgi:endoglucanase